VVNLTVEIPGLAKLEFGWLSSERWGGCVNGLGQACRSCRRLFAGLTRTDPRRLGRKVADGLYRWLQGGRWMGFCSAIILKFGF
jgi:hypothetical protein